MSLSTRDRRLLGAVLVAVLVAAPALVLRALCIGRSCEERAPVQAQVPFCSLPEQVRTALAAGYRGGRSPDALAVAGDVVVRGADGLPDPGPVWPALDAPRRMRVPLAFVGAGVEPGTLAPGARLDAVAPTMAELIGLERPHPEVGSGRPVPGVASSPDARLLVLVVWKGVGTRDLERRPGTWSVLDGLLRRGAATLQAEAGSLPLDPTAVLATIGTGGTPRQHGITGSTVRNDEGEVATVGRRGAPLSVIATLGDDLDEVRGQRPRIGVVAEHRPDAVVVGGEWYVDGDKDDVAIARGPAARQAEAAARLLADGYGTDDEPDLLVVTMEDRITRMDAALGSILTAAEAAAPGSVASVVTSTGSSRGEADLGDAAVGRRVERDGDVPAGAVAATAVGGLFLDQDVLAETGVSAQVAVRALGRMRTSSGPVFADAFSGTAVEFARYC